MTVQEAITIIELRRNELHHKLHDKYVAAEDRSQRDYFSGMVTGLTEALFVVRQALVKK